MRKITFSRHFCQLVLGVAFAVIATAQSAQAAPVYSLFQQGINQWEDDDFESLVFDAGNDGIIDVGDRFFGVFRVQGINNVGVGAAGSPTVTAVFALEAIRKIIDPVSGNVDLRFAPLQSGGTDAAIAEWAALYVSLGITGSLPTHDSTMAIVFAHPDFGSTTQFGGLQASVSSFDEMTPGVVRIAEFGFTGDYDPVTGRTDLDEFWRTFGGAGTDDPNAIPTLLITTGSPLNTISLNVTVQHEPLIEFNPHNELFGPLGFQPTALQGTGTFVASGVQNPGSWQLSTDTDFVVNLNIIPEPSGLVVFGMLFAMVAGGGLVRRRFAKTNVA